MNFYAYNPDDVDMVAGTCYGLAEEGVMFQFSTGKNSLSSPHSCLALGLIQPPI
jgi:hypothetical protein